MPLDEAPQGRCASCGARGCVLWLTTGSTRFCDICLSAWMHLEPLPARRRVVHEKTVGIGNSYGKR